MRIHRFFLTLFLFYFYQDCQAQKKLLLGTGIGVSDMLYFHGLEPADHLIGLSIGIVSVYKINKGGIGFGVNHQSKLSREMPQNLGLSFDDAVGQNVVYTAPFLQENTSITHNSLIAFYEYDIFSIGSFLMGVSVGGSLLQTEFSRTRLSAVGDGSRTQVSYSMGHFLQLDFNSTLKIMYKLSENNQAGFRAFKEHGSGFWNFQLFLETTLFRFNK